MLKKIMAVGLLHTKAVLLGLSGLLLVMVVSGSQSQPVIKQIKVTSVNSKPFSNKDSLDQKTGLIIAPGFNIVSTTCVKCHSPKLITEKRATREGWLATIRWMQQNQGLWDLGKEEPVILDYLAKNYAPQTEGRRPNLKVTEWYKLNN